MSKEERYLVADIGGTNTRIAIGDRSGSLHALRAFPHARLADLEGALREAADMLGAPRRAVLAVAGAVDGETFRLTNWNWSSSRTELARALNLQEILVVNDFVAMAHSVPVLPETDLLHMGGGKPDMTKNILVCGPGTGFGAAALVRWGRVTAAVATEAGHMSLGAEGAEERAVFARLGAAEARLKVEDLLSGRGLVALHKAMTGTDIPSEAIIANAQGGEETCARTVAFFMRLFGRMAGDLALAFDARGGIFIGGGVGRALRDELARPSFRHSFEAHPPYEERMRAIPICVILHDFPGLIGALEIAKAEFA